MEVSAQGSRKTDERPEIGLKWRKPAKKKGGEIAKRSY